MNKKQLSVGHSNRAFTFEDVERAVTRWNSLGTRRWLAAEMQRSNADEFLRACCGNPEALRELLHICPEVIETVPAVARALALLFKQATHQNLTAQKDSTPARARRVVASLVPRSRGGKKPIPKFIIAQVGRHCYGTAYELKEFWKRCGGSTNALLVNEPWLKGFLRRHYGQDWETQLRKFLRITEDTTPYKVGAAVAAKILCVHPDTVRRAMRQFPGSKQSSAPPPTWWADLPISSLRPSI